MRRVPLRTRRERVDTPDGDFVNLDWVGDRGPIVVVLPGLQGDLQSAHVRGLLRACAGRGWRGVLLNYRGRGEPNRLRHSYHCGRTDDVDFLAGELRRREPDTPIAVVGYSVGGNICLKWLGEAGQEGRKLPICAAVGVSVPFHLGVVAKTIESGFSRLYQWRLLKSLHRDLIGKMDAVDLELDLQRSDVGRLDTFFKFDDCVSGPLHGFHGAEDYYARTRSDQLLHCVSVPTLIVNSRDDPMVPAHLIPGAHSLSEHVRLEITDRGGHMGFVGGSWPWAAKFWLESRIPAFLNEFI